MKRERERSRLSFLNISEPHSIDNHEKRVFARNVPVKWRSRRVSALNNHRGP